MEAYGISHPPLPGALQGTLPRHCVSKALLINAGRKRNQWPVKGLGVRSHLIPGWLAQSFVSLKLVGNNQCHYQPALHICWAVKTNEGGKFCRLRATAGYNSH